MVGLGVRVSGGLKDAVWLLVGRHVTSSAPAVAEVAEAIKPRTVAAVVRRPVRTVRERICRSEGEVRENPKAT
nr:hypothetical protein GCM10017745_51300 [Saccharothrix mutabilis subsp. capreolus]